jgi:hypothetical protein
MITSSDVQQAMMQQQQAMMQTSGMNYMMGGLGAYGSAYMPPPIDLQLSNPIALPQMAFPNQGMGQGYNYGGTNISYGWGNMAASRGVGALGSAYSAASMGATAMGAYGGYKLGGTIGSAMKGALGVGGLPMAIGGLGPKTRCLLDRGGHGGGCERARESLLGPPGR